MIESLSAVEMSLRKKSSLIKECIKLSSLLLSGTVSCSGGLSKFSLLFGVRILAALDVDTFSGWFKAGLFGILFADKMAFSHNVWKDFLKVKKKKVFENN